MPVRALGGLRPNWWAASRHWKRLGFNAREGFGWFETHHLPFQYNLHELLQGFNAREGFGWFETMDARLAAAQLQVTLRFNAREGFGWFETGLTVIADDETQELFQCP